MVTINNHNWYYRLVSPLKGETEKRAVALFDKIPRGHCYGKILVCLVRANKQNRAIQRLYSIFNNYIDFGIYQLNFPPAERCFFEIILGEYAQKPHFDIDIGKTSSEIDGDAIKDDCINAIIKVLAEKNISLDLAKDLLVFTSHGVNKQSYHLVINNYYHANNDEARYFYDKVITKMNPEMSQWIDHAVYTKTQQFRMVGSCKLNTNRIKKFQTVWYYYDQEIEHVFDEDPEDDRHEMVLILEESMVSFIGTAIPLPIFATIEEINKSSTNPLSAEDIDVTIAMDAIKMLAAMASVSINSFKFPYSYKGIQGPLVMLNRRKPSKCRVCKRIHYNENPYLLIIGDEKEVYFDCRRNAQGKKLFIGKLDPKIESDLLEDEEVETAVTTLPERLVNHRLHVLARTKALARTPSGKKISKPLDITKDNPKAKTIMNDVSESWNPPRFMY